MLSETGERAVGSPPTSRIRDVASRSTASCSTFATSVWPGRERRAADRRATLPIEPALNPAPASAGRTTPLRRRRVGAMRSRDRTAEAHAVQFDAYRSLTPVERLEPALSTSDELMAVMLAGIRSRQPALTPDGAIEELHQKPDDPHCRGRPRDLRLHRPGGLHPGGR